MRLLFYSHDGQGLGHVRRNLAIAAAVTEASPTASVLLVSSTDHVDGLVIPPRVDILKLPGVRKVGNLAYAPRRLVLHPEETWALRSALTASAATSFTPHVLLSDKHPLGAHGELRAALHAVRARGGRTVLGLRDILDEPATVRAEWRRSQVLPAIAAHYDRVLVYGSERVLDQPRAYGMPPEVARLVRYCGYVVSRAPADERSPLRHDADPRPTVLATAGAGEDGHRLLARFLEVSRGAPWHPVVVSGSDAPAEHQDRLRREAAAVGGTYHRFVRNLPVHLDQVAALVCMGGYNTLAEAVGAAVPTVVVPRVRPRQEQALRARAFADLGLLRVVDPGLLDGGALRTAVDAAVREDRRDLSSRVARTLELDGARRAAVHLTSLAAHVPTARPELAHVAV